MFSKVFISGSLPLLVSCILQSIFKIYGPFTTLYGSVVWFQKPINSVSGITGLFSNQNYTGLWLSILLVFLYYEIKSSKRNLKIKFIPTILISLTAYFLVLTDSRNAFFGNVNRNFLLFKKKIPINYSIVFKYFCSSSKINFQ